VRFRAAGNPLFNREKSVRHDSLIICDAAPKGEPKGMALNFVPLPPRAFALKTGVLIFLNGQFVPEECAVVSVFDRSFLYGDGLFETMRVFRGKPFRWQQHLDRLQRGADFLKIKLPHSAEALRGFVDELIAKNKMPEALLRLTLSRGVGMRGYSPKGANHPTIVMSLHPAPASALTDPIPRWKLITSSHRLPANEPLAQFKTANKLAQILARAEADAAGADEALLLDTDGYVVEGASSNLFWIAGHTICTPPLASGVLPGVTRAVVMEICEKLGLKTSEGNITDEKLKHADGIFVSLSSFGIVEVGSLNALTVTLSPLVKKIQETYSKFVDAVD
jgi:branched-chain amino acid aminotransferase